MISILVRACGLLVLVLVLLAHASFAGDWPQWRGPERTGRILESSPTPKSLPSEPKVLWRVKAGDSLASPVVADGKVFHVDNVAGKETVHALDAATGHEVWNKELDEAFKDAQSTPGPRCTPLFDTGRLYAQSCRGELKCFDARDGSLLWRVNYVTNFGASFIGEKGQAQGAVRHGYNGSPVIDGEHLITLAGGTNGAGVVCFDKASGRVVWKSGKDPAAYAPPVIATLAGRKQVVAFTCIGLIGVDRQDGAELWRVPLTTTFSRHVTTPTIAGDTVLVSSHEWGLIAVRVAADGSGQKAECLWTNKPAAINFASPVAVEKHLYGLGSAKNLVCVDTSDGKLAWSQPGFSVADATKAHASFLIASQNLFVLTDGGQLVLVEANPKEFRELGRTQICGRTWCNPAYADGKLFVRDGRELLCVGLVP